MNKNSSFVYFKKYENYVKQKDQISTNSLVFVEDRNSIWTHGVEFGGSGVTIEQDGTSWVFKNNAGETLATITTTSITQEQIQQLIASGVTITVDSELSDTSTNAIQNKVVKAALDTKLDTTSYTVDDTLSDESTNPIQNKAVKKAIDAITIPSLSEYLKKSDADDTYATKDDLSSVTPDTTGLLTEDDLEGYCTTDYVSGTYATKEDLNAKADASSLSGYATTEALNSKVDSSTLNTKETEIKNWVEGKGYLTSHQSLADYATKAELAAIDTSVFLIVDELPEDNINVNKIYIYNDTQYRYVPEPEVEEGEEVPEGEYGWIAIGEANASVDLAEYLKSATAASTYATKASLNSYAQVSALNDYVPILSVYYPSGDIPYTPEGQEGYEEAIKLVDTTLDNTSTNPIQNKAVADALATKADSSYVASNYATKQQLTNLQGTVAGTYATKAEVTTGLAAKQNVLTAGDGISISNGVISSTIDNDLYIIVDELPLLEINPNKIYILETQNDDGSYSYTEYRYRQRPEDPEEEEENAAYGWFPIGRELESPDFSGLASQSDLDRLATIVDQNNSAALHSTDLIDLQTKVAALREQMANVNSFGGDYNTLVSRLETMFAPIASYITGAEHSKDLVDLYSYLHKRLNWIQERIATQYVLKKDVDPDTTRHWSSAETYEFDVNEATKGPSFVTLSKAKYDELVQLGQVSKDIYYFTYEGEDEPAGETWQFGGTFPITLTDNWTFGGTFPIRLK